MALVNGMITVIRGLHLTGAAQVSALPPESAWQVLDPGLTCEFCNVDRRSTPVRWRPLTVIIILRGQAQNDTPKAAKTLQSSAPPWNCSPLRLDCRPMLLEQ
jgi:hypothetical protein